MPSIFVSNATYSTLYYMIQADIIETNSDNKNVMLCNIISLSLNQV